MSDSLWNRVVTIKPGNQATYSLRTSREAAWFLLDDWPIEKGIPYRNALYACSNALEGKGSDAIARFLVVSAALDANFDVEVSGDIHEADPVLADLTEAAFRELFGL